MAVLATPGLEFVSEIRLICPPERGGIAQLALESATERERQHAGVI